MVGGFGTDMYTLLYLKWITMLASAAHILKLERYRED